MIKNIKQNSFSLIEILIVVGILLLLGAIAYPAFNVFRNQMALSNSSEEIVNTLRLVQNKTLASEESSQYGVYFDTSSSPHQYTFFKGSDYASRDVSYDVVHEIADIVEIYEIDLEGGGNEVVFEKVTGSTYQSGKVSVRLSGDPSRARTIGIRSTGQISIGTEVPPSDTIRTNDSRHVHFDYSRDINTATESIVLNFEGGVTETIAININLIGGQLFWEGDVDVNGEIQRIKIHTHRLNSPDTRFCVHRDRRYNTKALTIDIDDSPDFDPGTLVEYSADGIITDGTSVFIIDDNYELQ